MEQVVKWVIKDKPKVKTVKRLQYIDNGLMATPEISILQAQKEIVLFAERLQRMFGMVCVLLDEKDKKEFERQYERIAKYEDIADNMEFEIASYLKEVSNKHLSDESKSKIRGMLRQISELESIGDACYTLARAIQHKHNGREDFTAQQYTNLHEMLRLVNEALTQMMVVISGRREDLTIDISQEIEHDINVLRDKLRAESLNDINEHKYSYALGSYYDDIITRCEELGDYVMNVIEARLGKRFLTFRGLRVNLDRKTVTIDGTSTNLTRTEFNLLCELLSNSGQVLSRQQLMNSIWDGVIVTERTVDVNITRLRKKLGPYAQNIVSRQGFGYVFEKN